MTKTMRALLILNSIWMVLCALMFFLLAFSENFDFRMSPQYPYDMLTWSSYAIAFFLIGFSIVQHQKPRPWLVFILFVLHLAILFSWFCIDISDTAYDYWIKVFMAVDEGNQLPENLIENPNIPLSVFPRMIRISIFHALLFLPTVYVNIIHPFITVSRPTPQLSSQLTSEVT